MIEIKFVIKGKLDGLNEYINACRANRYKGADMKKKNERLVMAYILQAVNFGEIYEVKNYPIKLNINWYEPNSRRDVDNVTFATKFIQDSWTDVKRMKELGITEEQMELFRLQKFEEMEKIPF